MPARRMGAKKPVNSLISIDRASMHPERTSQISLLLRCQMAPNSTETRASAMEGTPIITATLRSR